MNQLYKKITVKLFFLCENYIHCNFAYRKKNSNEK